jgi:predicted phosphoribosyltransferase
MKDAYEILHEKEADLARVRREIDSLTIAASLLVDDGISNGNGATVAQEKKSVRSVTSPEPVASAEAQAFVWPRSGFWSALKLRR